MHVCTICIWCEDPSIACAEELPAAARFRIVIVSKDGNERRNPIKVCNVHQQWNSGKHSLKVHVHEQRLSGTH